MGAVFAPHPSSWAFNAEALGMQCMSAGVVGITRCLFLGLQTLWVL